jgi:hypothetical protein
VLLFEEEDDGSDGGGGGEVGRGGERGGEELDTMFPYCEFRKKWLR